MTELLELKAKIMSEAELLESIIELAETFGWLTSHSRPARKENGEWRTAIQGDKGAPDLLLARSGVVLVIETKSEKGKLTKEQEEWHQEANTIIWRPSQWLSGEIEKALK